MATTDNEATSINNKYEDATEIVHPDNASNQENQIQENDISASAEEENKSKHKIAKTVGGVAAGGAVLGGAASVFMNLSDDSPIEITEDSIEEEKDNVAEDVTDNVTIAAEMVELPEVVVEALAPKHNETINATATTDIHEEMEISSSEQVYAEVTEPKPHKADNSSYIQNQSDETIAAQAVGQPKDDPIDMDIPIVSVGNASDGESDIQILGVTQDISTGYNVGHLSVDGEEVVVIDVDGDMVFDSIVVDLNHDGETTPDEIIDIRQQSLSLEDLNSDFFNSLTSNGDTPDYLSEMVE